MPPEPFRKADSSAPAGFFQAEANGLRWLGEVGGGPPVPEVLDVADGHITMIRLAPARATADMADVFGRRLAVMHAAGAPAYGADWPGFIGPLPMDNTPTSGPWPQWYAERRVLPFLQLARDRGTVTPEQSRLIESACDKLPDTGEPPARIHGDLWSGNLMWATDGQVWLIDPAAHGGHRETDLAMLVLFGAPHLDRIFAAYDESCPLVPGWRERVGLHQLHPLLVHAVLFGGGYGARAAAVARSPGLRVRP